MLQDGKRFKSVDEIKTTFAERGLSLDGISCHCPFWVHTTAWTGSPTVRPFLPPDVADKSAKQIEEWLRAHGFPEMRWQQVQCHRNGNCKCPRI